MSKPGSLLDPIVRHGAILLPDVIVDYDIRQPAPTQWVAVGIVRSAETTGGQRTQTMPRLLVGSGASEAQAIYDLCRRLIGRDAHIRSDAPHGAIDFNDQPISDERDAPWLGF